MLRRLNLGARIATVSCTAWCFVVAVVGVDGNTPRLWTQLIVAIPPALLLLVSLAHRWILLRPWSSALMTAFATVQVVRALLADMPGRTKAIEVASFGLIAVLVATLGVVWSVAAGVTEAMKRAN